MWLCVESRTAVDSSCLYHRGTETLPRDEMDSPHTASALFIFSLLFAAAPSDLTEPPHCWKTIQSPRRPRTLYIQGVVCVMKLLQPPTTFLKMMWPRRIHGQGFRRSLSIVKFSFSGVCVCACVCVLHIPVGWHQQLWGVWQKDLIIIARLCELSRNNVYFTQLVT